MPEMLCLLFLTVETTVGFILLNTFPHIHGIFTPKVRIPPNKVGSSAV